jgi:hypothetical protein
MSLSVIGAGFGRTGTESMKLALEMLGLGPCHHMKEVLGDPEQTALWRGIAAGDPPDWEAAFTGYNAAVDWPSAFFWRELADVYPDAKILLTVRSPESWHASMDKTIFRTLRNGTDPDSLGVKLVAEGVFDGRLDDPAHAIATYERNTAEVEAAFPPERLLTYHLGDGWEPLCRFLGKPLPNAPYPRSNSAKEFNAMFSEMNNIDEE